MPEPEKSEAAWLAGGPTITTDGNYGTISPSSPLLYHIAGQV